MSENYSEYEIRPDVLNYDDLRQMVLESDKIAFTFLRSIVSSQAASWVDLFMGFALFAWVGFTPFLSTAIGAFAGGVINCMINYLSLIHI